MATKKAQIEAMAAGIRDLKQGEYYTVQYNRPVSGEWAYRTFRSKKVASKFAVEVPLMPNNRSTKVEICHNGFAVKETI